MVFEKEYKVKVKIDLEKCNNVYDYALEEWEFSDEFQSFHDKVANDLWDFMEKKGIYG